MRRFIDCFCSLRLLLIIIILCRQHRGLKGPSTEVPFFGLGGAFWIGVRGGSCVGAYIGVGACTPGVRGVHWRSYAVPPTLLQKCRVGAAESKRQILANKHQLQPSRYR